MFAISRPMLLRIAFTLAAFGMTVAPTFAQDSGIAVYYSDYFQGKPVANGETYDRDALTAAHNGYPYGSMVEVTNIANGKTVVVKINDRMRSNSKPVIDLSYRAAQELDFIEEGVTQVTLKRVNSDDDSALASASGKPSPVR